MKVQVIDASGRAIAMMPNLDETEAEFKEYTNKITGKPDPMIVYAPGRWCHMSTVIEKFGYQVRNIETGEIIEMPK